MNKALFALMMIVCQPAWAMAGAMAADARAYQQSMERAGEAFEAEDWPALNEALDAAQAVRPWSLYIYRNRILARMLAGRTGDALALAGKTADRGLALRLAGHPAFETLTALPEFAPIAAKMGANMAPLDGASRTLEYEQTELLPEAITFDAKKNLYVGSVRNGSIFRSGKKDITLSLITGAPGGVYDLEVRGDVLWAAVNNQLAYEGADPDQPFASIMAFNAKNGAPIREIRVAEGAALLGDLEVAKDGTVYASDSLTPRLFRIKPNSQTIDVFVEDHRFANLQGIALDERNHRLFVADYLTGLFVIDTDTGGMIQIENTADAHLGGIDGLYYHDGALIGIQNGTSPHRIVRIGLNPAATEVTTFIVLQQNLDSWNEPTHGAITGKEFRYIATSNWPSYGEDWSVREGAELKPLRIMTLPLTLN